MPENAADGGFSGGRFCPPVSRRWLRPQATGEIDHVGCRSGLRRAHSTNWIVRHAAAKPTTASLNSRRASCTWVSSSRIPSLFSAREQPLRYLIEDTADNLTRFRIPDSVFKRYARWCAGLDHAMSDWLSYPVWETVPAERQHGLVRTLGQMAMRQIRNRRPHISDHRGDRR